MAVSHVTFIGLQVRVLAASPNMFSNALEYLILDIKCPNNESTLLTVMYRRPKGLIFSDFVNVLSFFFSHIKI